MVPYTCVCVDHTVKLESNPLCTHTDYGRDLERDVVSDTSGNFKRLLVSMLTVIVCYFTVDLS